MSQYDWTSFTRRITIKAPTGDIYDAWSTRKGFESWFLRQALFLRNKKPLDPATRVMPGDRYQWLWFGYPDSTMEEGEILSANGNDQVQFTFSGGCIVTVRMYSEQNETICELVQSNIGPGEEDKINYHLGCSTGWTFYLANLKSVLEGGLDLRNKNDAVSQVVNA